MATSTNMPSSITEEISPSLPDNFPKTLMPKNICEVEFLELLRCTTYFGVQMKCQKQYDAFRLCKRDRDTKLYNSIQEWETGYVGKMASKERDTYVKEMEKKVEKLTGDYERIPYAASYFNKLLRYGSDIEQLQWRIDYIKKAYPSSNNNKDQNNKK